MNKLSTPVIGSLLLLLIFSTIVFIYNNFLGGVLILITLAVALLLLFIHPTHGVRAKIGSFPSGFEYRLDQITEPVLLIDDQGTYHWYNDAFYQSFYRNTRSGLNLEGRNIRDELHILPEKFKSGEDIIYSSRSSSYEVVPEVIKKGLKPYYLLHFLRKKGVIDEREIAAQYEPIFCYISIDNYDEIVEELSSSEQMQASANLATLLTEWVGRKDGLLLNYENDRYLVVFDKEKIDLLVNAGFRILDEVREVTTTQGSFTLSIGIGISEKVHTIAEANEISKRALKIAQERGGDQAVIKTDDELTVFGGRRETKSKQTKTKARVKAEALEKLIEDADNVLIVGHQNPDMDCFGAAVGLIDACRDMEKTAKYVFSQEDNVNFGILKKYLAKSDDYENAFISSSEVADWIRDETLLIVVDTRSLDYIDCPELLETVDNVVVIDHHLQPRNAIENSALEYIEPAASSASELVARILEYFESKSILTSFGANALMAGIYMDTRQFAQHIGVCTFEAAAYLMRKGADMNCTRNLLRDDFVVLASKSSTTKNAQFYFDGIFAVAMCEDYTENAERIKAGSADDLLNVKGVKASFVLLKSKNGISISARSTSDIEDDERMINVCQILEPLGGGGHHNMAGAQISTVDSLAEAKERLLEQIGRYVEQTEAEESNAY